VQAIDDAIARSPSNKQHARRQSRNTGRILESSLDAPLSSSLRFLRHHATYTLVHAGRPGARYYRVRSFFVVAYWLDQSRYRGMYSRATADVANKIAVNFR
jgi:hypothetical protein